jgi:hypothetical protein
VSTRIALPAGGWHPRPYQANLWGALEGGVKRATAVWHRRAGKDEVCLHWTACAVHERTGNYWHMLPEASQARKAIWEALNPHTGKRRIDEAFPLEIRAATRETDMLIRFRCGSIWQVIGSDNYKSVLGSPPIGVVFSEWARANPAAWDYIRPILAENGGWALFITTPLGRNHAHKMFQLSQEEPGWYGERLPVSETGAIPQEVLDAELRELKRLHGEEEGEALYRQEYEVSWDAAIPGAYYARIIERMEAEGRIGSVPHDRRYPVTTLWDIGVGDSNVIWFIQQVGPEVRWIDHDSGSGVGIDEYVRRLQQKAVDRDFVYDEHLLPHDANASEWGTGKTRVETMFTLLPPGLGRIRVVSRSKVDDGIQATRQLLYRSVMDAEHCKRGIEALRQYHREWDEAKQAFKDKPEHDWTSDHADAARTGGMGLRDQFGEPLDDAEYYQPPRPYRGADGRSTVTGY